jgi:ketosteroid isomerase-like protein
LKTADRDMSATHPNAIKLRDAIESVSRGSLDVDSAFAPDLVWRIVGSHPLAGEHRGLDGWRDLMRRRTQLTGGTYRPQPQAWLGSDRYVFCFLRLTARRDDGREIDTSHVAVFRMGDDGLAHEFWDVSSDQQLEDAFWA